MDLYDDSRTLIHSGPVARRVGDSWHNWNDLLFALFDNYRGSLDLALLGFYPAHEIAI